MRDQLADPRRFQREARIAAQLQHPGITVVHDFGTHGGLPFIVMELLHGQDLAYMLGQASDRQLPVDVAVSLIIQAAEALQAAHAGGVIHRDLKPANLFLQNDGRLKICDFGIARRANATDGLTSDGYLIGTVYYMSPEQCEGVGIDRRSDLYSLGCVFYELLTGQPPFPTGEALEIMRQHRTTPPVGSGTLRSDIPRELDFIVLNMLAKKPEDRPSNASDVAAALKRLMRSSGGGQTTVEAPRTYVVDRHGRGDFTTVTAAIRAARPGDRILVRPGLYEEGLVVDKSLDISGEGPVSDIEIRARNTHVLLFQAATGLVSNLTLRQTGGNDCHGVEIRQGQLQLDGCDISSRSAACVAIRDGADPLLRRNNIHNGAKSGVLFRDGGQGTLENNDITRNGTSGVIIRAGAKAILHRNRIQGNDQSGVFVYDRAFGTLEDNDITGNGLVGVSVKTSGKVFVRGNRITRNEREAIWVRERGSAVVEDNDLRYNADGAWDVAPGSEGYITSARNREL
jgi:parallel beta-helix repeat protein